MNPSLQRQHVMQKQMLEHQARMVASRQRDMLGAAWFDAEARKSGMERLRTGAAAPAADAKRGWPATRLLFWLMAVAVAARLLTSL